MHQFFSIPFFLYVKRVIILKVREKGASKNTRSIDIAPHGKQKERAKATHCPNQAKILKDLEKKRVPPHIFLQAYQNWLPQSKQSLDELPLDTVRSPSSIPKR